MASCVIRGSPCWSAGCHLFRQQLQAAYDLGEIDGRVTRNPVRFVDRVEGDAAVHDPWSVEELQKFIAAACADRLEACWWLAALGLRRGEVCGLKWSDIDREKGTITISRSRVVVDEVIEKGPKSKRSYRTLPMFPVLAAMLDRLEARQLEELAAAGGAYDTASGYVLADELGRPLRPERFTDEFHRIAKEAGVRRIRLHDTRATMNTILERAGVPETIRAAWLGDRSRSTARPTWAPRRQPSWSRSAPRSGGC